MSGNPEEEKETQKVLPLDLAGTQITAIRTVESTKAPLVMTSQALRSVRVLAQGIPNSNLPLVGQTLITNLVPQAVIKPDSNRTQIAGIIGTAQPQLQPSVSTNLSLQRPTQITLAASPIVQNPTGTSYHVPRGPAVVANLAAPRSNVATVRTPLVVTAQNTQSHTFVRPPRCPSPAQGTAWLTTNKSNTSQIKGVPAVLSSPIRSAGVPGKPQTFVKPPQTIQGIPQIKAGTLVTTGQTIQSFKPISTNIQNIGATVTLTQMLPARSQTVVYNASSSSQFTPAARITVTTTAQSSVRPQIRTMESVSSVARTPISSQSTSLNSNARLIGVPGSSPQSDHSNIVTTQLANVGVVNRLSVAPQTITGGLSTANNILTSQTRISTLNLQSLVAVSNGAPATRIQTTQGARMFPQTTQGTIHLAQIPSPTKATSSAITSGTVAISTNPQQAPLTTSTPYSIESQEGGSYFYENATSNAFQRSLITTQQQHHQAQIQLARPTVTVNNQQLMNGVRFNSVMVVEQNRNQQFQPISTIPQIEQHSLLEVSQGQQQTNQQSHTKMNPSPRPTILRKREHEGSTFKAAKNLTPALQNNPQPMRLQSSPSPPSPPRPDSRNNGHNSGGSTTISATSSPGLVEFTDDSNPLAPINIKEDEEEEEETKPFIEMSPRKKPRKQQLTGNDMDENHDDMQFISDGGPKIKKDAYDSDGPNSDSGPRDGAPEAVRLAPIRKPATASLLNGYRQTWKATHNHYQRYSDVKPKDDRRPTIMDLANQNFVQDKINGWKIHHLSTQMEDLADQEQTVYTQLTDLLKITESEENTKQDDREVNRVNELIKGNLQRIKIINDGMLEAKCHIMKIFDHHRHINDIISRCASKRNFKKREKF